MVKTKREFILASCFLSGAAAIVSFISLGTREWVTADAYVADNFSMGQQGDHFSVGLFGGTFDQKTVIVATVDLSMACLFDKNICALLCGQNMLTNLEKLYNGHNVTEDDTVACATVQRAMTMSRALPVQPRAVVPVQDRVFINAGIWVCTIIFLILSAVFGLFSAGLSIWNTVSNPYQVYFSIFGLYIYNGIAFCSILLATILWGAMFAQDLTQTIPSYKTFLEDFTTKDMAALGYSYWINLISLFFYLASIAVLYLRQYLISKEPAKTIQHIEDNADPGIYLY